MDCTGNLFFKLFVNEEFSPDVRRFISTKVVLNCTECGYVNETRGNNEVESLLNNLLIPDKLSHTNENATMMRCK